MVHSCAAINCTARWTKGVQMKFHRIPARDCSKRKAWLHAMRRNNYNPSRFAYLCEKHFLESDYAINVFGNRNLKKGAIPSIFDFPLLPPKKVVKERRTLKRRETVLEKKRDAINFGDFQPSDMDNEVKRKMFWKVAHKTLSRYRKLYKYYQWKVKKQKTKIKNINAELEEFKKLQNLPSTLLVVVPSTCRQQDQNLKENHYAATVIQRSYRGYVVRRGYRKIIRAVIVLQKYIKAWLVRYHLPDEYHEYWDRLCRDRYDRAAIKLQAIWKGILVRNEIDIAQIMEEKRRTAERSTEFDHVGNLELDYSMDRRQTQIIMPQFDEADIIPFGGAPVGHETYLKAEILDLLFDRHHLLSTKIHSGVLKSNSELKAIEKVLKYLPWKDFMNDMKKLYYKNQKVLNSVKPTYVFRDRRMRLQEDLQRLRDKSHDVREVYMGKYIADSRKPFNLHPKPRDLSHEKSILTEGKYVKRETNITRTEDKSKNICDKDFIFALKEIVKDCGLPPYYADFWYKDCIGHNFPN